MASLTVEGIPPGLLLRLSASAAANGRCLNSEVIVQLARAANSGAQTRPAARQLPGAVHCRSGRGCACGSPLGQRAGARVGWGGPPDV